jgi:hypothetical protein
MEQLGLIRAAHEIDRSLSRLAAAVSDEQLKKDVLAVQDRWRDLGYAVTAELCGLGPDSATPARRRGRRKHADTLGEVDRTPEEPSGGNAR